jgi:hypothetical protein
VPLEAEFTTTISAGDVDIGGFTGDWDIDTQATCVAARLGEKVYPKVRYGVLQEGASIKIAGFS